MKEKVQTIRIGTRGSPLALWQAREVQAKLLAADANLQTEIIIIKTSGDWNPSDGEAPLSAAAGGKRQFAKELEEALMAQTIDIAVHSLKDMDSILPEGLEIACVLPREDARDALLTRTPELAQIPIIDWPVGTTVGTSSVRRAAMLRALNPALKIIPLRGNVETRITKLRGDLAHDFPDLDATLLAAAGLIRLDLGHEINRIIPEDEMLPAAAQGTICIETLANNNQLIIELRKINCPTTELRVTAERAVLYALDGSCHTPVGAHATFTDEQKTILKLDAQLLSPDGVQILTETVQIPVTTPEAAHAMGLNIGNRLKTRAAQTQ